MVDYVGLTRNRLIASVEKNQLEECGGNDEGEFWNLNDFLKSFSIDIVRRDENEIEFDLIGLDAAIVNALRRIVMSEVPTMAIEKVFINNNTSIFQDDFLAHRLGLIPIQADPRLFEIRKETDTEGTPQDTIELTLQIKCTKNTDSAASGEAYVDRKVYSKHIKWNPLENQSDLDEKPIKPVLDDILIAKLSPGQEIDLKMHCVKGIGRDHAKFSPVATVHYRLLPVIHLKEEVVDDDAYLLQSCFSKGVIDVKTRKGKAVAIVANPRNDSLSRNFYLFPKFEKIVQMGLRKNHFIFTIESTGILAPDILFIEACRILSDKCRHFIQAVEVLKNQQ